MHAPAETESPALEAAAPNGETSQPVRRSARRRLVQSKLFPHRSPEIESNGGLRGNGDGEDAQEEEEEDCGSQGRKRKTRKGKATPQNKTPKKSKEKSPRKSTPRKGRASNREGSSPQSAEKQEVSPAIPNLRLEEKLKKEKFSWAFSEKEVHPFFSSWKENKRASHEAAQVDTAGSLVQMKNKNITVAPIHVFDRDQDDAVSLDWRNFEFSGDPFNNGTMYAEPSSSSVMGSTVSQSVQEFPDVSHFSSTSLLQDGVSLDHCFPKPEPKHEASTSVSTMPSDAQAACCPLERVAQPVCGNSEAVKFLNEWLRTWYQGAHQTDRDSFAGIESDMQDTDYKCSLSECDSEDIDEGDTLKNVLLITGPVGADNEVVEVIPISNEDSFQGAGGIFEKVAYKESSVSCGKGQLKHLILFEDVDVAFAEDRGFVAAVCFAEKANIQPHLIEQVIKSCQGDIRKTIMHLQFWSLGENHREGREVEGLTEQLLSDPEFMHHLLPKLIPWDFPSQLSELVEKEISMSLSMEENSDSVEVIEDKCDDKEMQKTFDLHHLETASMKAKKEEMLSRNFSDEDFQDYKTPLDAPCDFNSSGTPVSFSRRNRRRNFDVVLSSDSDDDFPNKKFHFSPDKDAKNEETYIDSGLPSHCASVQNCLSLLTDLQPGFQAEKPAEKHYSCSDTVRDLQIAGTCESIDVSCVPESSFVPETIIDIGTEVSLDGISSGHVASPLCEVSVSNEIKQNELPAEANNGCKSTMVNPKDVVLSGSICEEIAVSSQEFNDSQPECVEAMTRECQIMDECSRMDFKQNFRPVENHGSSVGGNLASNPWRKLRDGRTDLKFLVTSENKNVTAILKLACGMSNLISDAELLYSRCQMLSSLESTELCEAYSFGCYSEQLKLTSNIAQHGFFSYSKDIDAVGSNLGSDYRVNLTKEMLSLSSMMKASLLPGRNIGTCETSLARPIMETSRPDCGTLLDRSETARLSNDIGKTKRRRRARHYLSAGSLMLSLNQISLLDQSNIYNKIPSR
ncbi:hypothetical protein Tsubulata_019002 [Turnera subulata]|uniref:Uncharacterized protein n=1 Tax=Turnera subulata TaxID=218843 RepID=A0A9Q0GJ87_9ROSI|nr:hypothetical protein Tsubulata_019002 [Turnera subulata]